MRIDRFTKPVVIGKKNFLTNFRLGVIDEIKNYLINEINELKERGSFTILECGLEKLLIEKMIERGYITYYSDREELDEVKWLVERYKERAKKEKKTASILLDTIVGRKWCSSIESSENISIKKENAVNILRTISKGKLANEINLWLIIKDRESEWTWIKGEADKNGLKIKNLYTLAQNETELEEIKNWQKTSISSPITINVKYELEEFGYISFSKLNGKNITEKKRTTFLEKHPFFCPFVYKTFFIDQEGNISYCVKKLLDGEKIGKIDIATGSPNLENGWSNGLFTPLCEKSEKCIYSIYCQKMCAFLNCLYEDRKNGDECIIAPTIKMIWEEKIRSMIKWRERFVNPAH